MVTFDCTGVVTKSERPGVFSHFSGSGSFDQHPKGVALKSRSALKQAPAPEADPELELGQSPGGYFLSRRSKSKIRKKLTAFADLMYSRNRKTYLWTISFSDKWGVTDKVAQKILNGFLTRSRQYYKSAGVKFSYLWVAERQKVGTIHFHIVVNTWLAKSVGIHYLRKRLQSEGFDASSYEGWDFRQIHSVKALKTYVTKYVVKNDATFQCAPWNCSQDISALFTTYITSADAIAGSKSSEFIYAQLASAKWKVLDRVSIAFMSFPFSRELLRLNQKVYDYLHSGVVSSGFLVSRDVWVDVPIVTEWGQKAAVNIVKVARVIQPTLF